MTRKATAVCAFFAMLALILDTKTVLQAVISGIELCMKAVIPALFPFAVISILLTSSLLGSGIRMLRPIGKLLRMPAGSESIWLIGCLAGYPMGAQCIAQAVKAGALSPADGKRMLCYCSIAGPSFIFGIGMELLGGLGSCFLVWGIQILSAMITGILTPGGSGSNAVMTSIKPVTLPEAMKKATGNIAMICSWVITFRIVTQLLQRRVFFLLPPAFQIIMTGILELANGSSALGEISSLSMRYMLFSGFLSFGGLCVAMQTASVMAETSVDFSWYLPSKIAQAACSVLLSAVTGKIQYPHGSSMHPMLLMVCFAVLFAYRVFAGVKRKEKVLAFRPAVVYNNAKIHTR